MLFIQCNWRIIWMSTLMHLPIGEKFTCAEFRSKDNQNYAFLSLPDNDALDFQATHYSFLSG